MELPSSFSWVLPFLPCCPAPGGGRLARSGWPALLLGRGLPAAAEDEAARAGTKLTMLLPLEGGRDDGAAALRGAGARPKGMPGAAELVAASAAGSWSAGPRAAAAARAHGPGAPSLMLPCGRPAGGWAVEGRAPVDEGARAVTGAGHGLNVKVAWRPRSWRVPTRRSSASAWEDATASPRAAMMWRRQAASSSFGMPAEYLGMGAHGAWREGLLGSRAGGGCRCPRRSGPRCPSPESNSCSGGRHTTLPRTYAG
jgi:hypothetical protein